MRQVRYAVGMTHENKDKIISGLVKKDLFDVLMPFVEVPKEGVTKNVDTTEA